MTANNIYDPLTEYVSNFRDRFQSVAERTFSELAREARVDVDANHETCRQIREAEERGAKAGNSLETWQGAQVALWVLAIGAVVAFFVITNEQVPNPGLVMAAVAVAAIALLLIFAKVRPRIEALKAERDEMAATVEALKAEAWEQMAPLNRLYDWDVLTRMMTETVPRLEFDNYFTTQRLADLEKTYGWDGSFNEERSVIYSHSGLINGNPFVICRTRRMQMGVKTYVGYKEIHWTRRERGIDGKWHSVRHTQTLSATVTAPFPEYPEETWLIYGNTAAPNLIFHRKKSGLANEEDSWSFRRKKNKLKKKARNLEEEDFAMLTNEDFEVAFDTSDRNDNQQFALMFTPLAQEAMMRLLKDREAGYGDDFDFDKKLMLNTIVADHMQELDLGMDPSQYRNWNYDEAERDFRDINGQYFKAIYFALAPLLCVPVYQQIRPRSAIYGIDMPKRSAFWEHEALANFWGQKHFQAPACVTQCILKTESKEMPEGQGTQVTVMAHGFRTRPRLTQVSALGGDGKMHKVPVEWDEYIPVTGQGSITLQEDNARQPDGKVTQHQRLDHINEVLHASGLTLYRRHIASRA